MTTFGGNTAESHYDEGFTASMKGELERAIRHFEEAIRLDNTMSSAYHQLGKCYIRVGNKKMAIKLLTQVVAKRPSQNQPRIDLGLALLSVGHTEDARKEFNTILDREPDNAKAMLGLGHAQFQEGHWNEAMSMAQNVLAVSVANFAVLYLLGRAARLAGNTTLAESSLTKAERLMEKSLELNPNHTESLYLRGEVCFAREKFPSALEHYRNAQEHTDDARAYSAYGENFTMTDVLAKQGLCLQRMGEKERAREIGQRVLELDPQHGIGQALSEA